MGEVQGLVSRVQYVPFLFKFAHDFMHPTSAESDVIYLDLMGIPFVILNTPKATKEIFEKRSALYSDRYAKSLVHT